MKKNKLSKIKGMPFFRWYVGENEKVNTKRRGVIDLGYTYPEIIVDKTGIRPDAPLMYCGAQDEAYKIVRELIRKTNKPFLLIGTKRDLERSPLLNLDRHAWCADHPVSHISTGNGIMELSSGSGETFLELERYIHGWGSHLLIICLGNGLQVDAELLNRLDAIGTYILISNALGRSIRNQEGSKLSVRELLSRMDYLFVTSAGNSTRDLSDILPVFQYEKYTDHMDIDFHQDGPVKKSRQNMSINIGKRRNAGIVAGQARTLEERKIFMEDELFDLQRRGGILIYKAMGAHVWVAEVR